MQQLLCHLIGDYIIQDDYCAINKSKRTLPCLIHCITYTLPFIFLTHNLLALFLIFLTHFVEDRWSLAKYFIWIKNNINPYTNFKPFNKCNVTGFYDTWINKEGDKDVRPRFITTWLYIFTDNTYHLLCNFLILKYIT